MFVGCGSEHFVLEEVLLYIPTGHMTGIMTGLYKFIINPYDMPRKRIPLKTHLILVTQCDKWLLV